MRVQLVLVLISGLALFNGFAATGQITVTKCCRGSYTILNDQCKPSQDSPNSADSQVDPPVHSRGDNRPIASRNDDFQLNYTLNRCQDGYVAQIVLDFRFYDDGSLTTSSGNSIEDFCLDRAAADPDPRWLARFCTLDPCRESGCIRKCCPQGMAIHEDTKDCQFHAEEFTPVIRDEDGRIINDSRPLIFDGGRAPPCSNGSNSMFSLRPDLYPGDEFYILPSGELYMATYAKDNRISKHCVDTFLDGNITDTRALMCFPEEDKENMWSQAQKVALNIYPYLMFISSVFLILTFIVYAAIPEIRSVQGVTVMCYAMNLAVMFISLGTIQLATDAINERFCIWLAVIAHFSFLSTFTWLNVMSFDIWWSFSESGPKMSETMVQFKQRRLCRFLIYSVYAWGLPLCIVTTARIMDLLEIGIRPNFGVQVCWFSDDTSIATYLYGPIGILVTVNIIFFLLTTVKLHQASNPVQSVINLPIRRKLYVAFCLFVLMGVSWMMEIISFAVGGLAYIWIPTDILNILTGIFIFVIFVCNRNVWLLIKRKCGCAQRPVTVGDRCDTSRNAAASISEQSQTFLSSDVTPAQTNDCVRADQLRQTLDTRL